MIPWRSFGPSGAVPALRAALSPLISQGSRGRDLASNRLSKTHWENTSGTNR
jgi:hypothetical protein